MVDSNSAASFRPYDVTQFRSRDAAAVVLLANSLGWRILIRDNGPVALIAEDGKQIRVPDNVGIKMDVFRGWVHQIAVHSNGSIDRDLANKIVKASKIKHEHARLIYELVEDDLAHDDMTLTQGQIDAINKATAPEVIIAGDGEAAIRLPKSVEPYILTREPFVNSKGDETGNAYTRTWSDGHVDYECVRCGAVFPTVKGVGSHKQMHIARGEVHGRKIKHMVPPERQRDYVHPKEKSKAQKPQLTGERMVQVPESVAAEAMRTLRLLEQIRSLLESDEVEQLTIELNEARLRIAKLEGNIKAFRDLLAEDM